MMLIAFFVQVPPPQDHETTHLNIILWIWKVMHLIVGPLSSREEASYLIITRESLMNCSQWRKGRMAKFTRGKKKILQSRSSCTHLVRPALMLGVGISDSCLWQMVVCMKLYSTLGNEHSACKTDVSWKLARQWKQEHILVINAALLLPPKVSCKHIAMLTFTIHR